MWRVQKKTLLYLLFIKVPIDQNHQYTKVAYFGVACPEFVGSYFEVVYSTTLLSPPCIVSTFWSQRPPSGREGISVDGNCLQRTSGEARGKEAAESFCSTVLSTLSQLPFPVTSQLNHWTGLSEVLWFLKLYFNFFHFTSEWSLFNTEKHVWTPDHSIIFFP